MADCVVTEMCIEMRTNYPSHEIASLAGYAVILVVSLVFGQMSWVSIALYVAVIASAFMLRPKEVNITAECGVAVFGIVACSFGFLLDWRADLVGIPFLVVALLVVVFRKTTHAARS